MEPQKQKNLISAIVVINSVIIAGALLYRLAASDSPAAPQANDMAPATLPATAEATSVAPVRDPAFAGAGLARPMRLTNPEQVRAARAAVSLFPAPVQVHGGGGVAAVRNPGEQILSMAAPVRIGLGVDRRGHISATTLPSLAPALVTLHVKDASPAEVLAQISRQAGVKFAIESGTATEPPWRPVTLDLDQQPAMEAVMEFCSQTGMTIPPRYQRASSADRLVLRPNSPNQTLGQWTVSGPFAFVVQQIERTAEISGAQQPQSLMLTVSWMSLPGVEPQAGPDSSMNRFVQGSLAEFRFTGGTDENGKPLGPGSFSAQTLYNVFNVTMACPPGFGDRLTRLAGTATLPVLVNGQATSTTVPFEFGDLRLR